MTDFIQPTLPPEEPLLDIEAYIAEIQPRNLWPLNQNSNFGLVRRLISEDLDLASTLLTELANETFIPTSTGYLSRWEKDLGLPPGQGGRTDAQRRSTLLARRAKGAFTWTRRATLVEIFLAETFGSSTFFTPDGIALDAGGIQLLADLGLASLHSAYRVYENVQAFSYEVWILNTVTPDLASLTRELGRITPAGIAFSVDNTKSEIIDWNRALQNTQPVWNTHYPGNTADDSSGYANNGILLGTPNFSGSHGLMTASAKSGSVMEFDGVNDQIQINNTAILRSMREGFSMGAWIQADSFSNFQGIIQHNLTPALFTKATGQVRFNFYNGTTSYSLDSNAVLLTGFNYFVVGTYDGKKISIYIDGVLDNSMPVNPISGSYALTSNWNVGTWGSGANYFVGKIDEPALWNYPLMPDAVKELHQQGIGVLL